MSVLLCSEINLGKLAQLLARYQLTLNMVGKNEAIPGSFWQPPEAGLISNQLYIRPDTPVHSALHEACHFICMDESRRKNLDTNAGGGYQEEDAVCYLQILLSAHVEEMGQSSMLSDMDTWGYSFRLGSAQAWFENDAEDAFSWLLENKLITADKKPTWQVNK